MMPSCVYFLVQNEFITGSRGAVKIMRAGNAGSGPLIRRRRREVALIDNIAEMGKCCMTLNLRLTYDFERLFHIIHIDNKGKNGQQNE